MYQSIEIVDLRASKFVLLLFYNVSGKITSAKYIQYAVAPSVVNLQVKSPIIHKGITTIEATTYKKNNIYLNILIINY